MAPAAKVGMGRGSGAGRAAAAIGKKEIGSFAISLSTQIQLILGVTSVFCQVFHSFSTLSMKPKAIFLHHLLADKSLYEPFLWSVCSLRANMSRQRLHGQGDGCG